MHPTIICATPEDARDIAVMTGELLQEIMDRINVKAFRFHQGETETRAAELLSRGVYYVFLARDPVTGEAIGFISLYESYALYTEGAYGTIPELYVRPAYRSMGVGVALLQRAKDFAAARGWKRLEVTTPPLPEFDRTLAFYERNTFEISGGRKLKSDIEVS
ncbi:GNAT family N-acetyltransferase [Sulfurimonas sp. HSL-3221]|uniref:GNAT family N-acetyltransferase n=1 Tax=Sulfurimonadaceae TaxID=2771471 RepID=UPI001E530AD1|nr:GNAT family N-acetyltransferase [Sulfurimonas sp. HSL-3221]UFS63465.1 GNAT family N-acetyltransferase [Sulfurimonas sp. HSL-3221]